MRFTSLRTIKVCQEFRVIINNMLSVAQDLVLTATVPAGVTLDDVKTPYTQEKLGASVRVTIPNLYSKEMQDVLVTLCLPPTEPTTTTLFCSGSYNTIICWWATGEKPWAWLGFWTCRQAFTDRTPTPTTRCLPRHSAGVGAASNRLHPRPPWGAGADLGD